MRYARLRVVLRARAALTARHPHLGPSRPQSYRELLRLQRKIEDIHDGRDKPRRALAQHQTRSKQLCVPRVRVRFGARAVCPRAHALTRRALLRPAHPPHACALRAVPSR